MPVRRFLVLIVGLDLAIVATLVIGVLAVGGPGAALGGLIGAALGTVNLVGLAWLGGHLIVSGGRRWIYALLLGMKFAAMIALVYLAVRYLDMDVIWFVVGLSTAGLAVVAGASYLALRDVELEV